MPRQPPVADPTFASERRTALEISMHFWAPGIDPAHPLDCSHPERYVLQRLQSGAYIAIDPQDQSLIDVADPQSAHGFHTHEAALRAAGELNKLGRGGVDVIKLD
ncbi:MAG: hypothetical protein ACK52U_15220 [Synechococcaceae cyanobacterium]